MPNKRRNENWRKLIDPFELCDEKHHFHFSIFGLVSTNDYFDIRQEFVPISIDFNLSPHQMVDIYLRPILLVPSKWCCTLKYGQGIRFVQKPIPNKAMSNVLLYMKQNAQNQCQSFELLAKLLRLEMSSSNINLELKMIIQFMINWNVVFAI